MQPIKHSSCPRIVFLCILGFGLVFCQQWLVQESHSVSDLNPSLEVSIDRHYNKSCIDAGCHPVGITGSILRHPPYLEGQCLSCHLDHVTTGSELLKRPMDSVCLSCHSSLELLPESHKLVHPPNGHSCTDCHNPHESRVQGLLRDSSQLVVCAECHADFLQNAQKRPYRHGYFDPVKQCGYCHYAHLRRAKKYLRENVSESCLICHDLSIQVGNRRLENVGERLRDAKVIHGGKGGLLCPSCHTPHGSDQSSLLKPGYPTGAYELYSSDKYDLCWQCHDPELVESVNGEGTTNFRNKEVNLHRVHVVELRRGRACHICHEPHASDRPHLLNERLRFGNWDTPFGYESLENGGFCQTPCHRDKEYER